MKRSSKFLLLLAIIMSGIVGVYFIGCEGDNTTINEPTPPDKVIGSVHGVIASDFDNIPLANVQVWWVSSGETHTVTSDSMGYYITDDILVSGEYEMTYSVNGYAVARETATIPTVEALRGEPGTPVSGDIPWSETEDIYLLPLNANLTGKVYTALPNPAPGKDDETPVAAGDSSNLVSPVANVEVILDYGYDIVPNRYQAFTDQNGQYTFTNVPWASALVQVVVMPFTVGDSSYATTTADVNLVHNGTATQPNIYATLDCTELPQVLKTNFSQYVDFHYDSLLRVTFSEPMDTFSFDVTLDPAGDTAWSYTLAWSLSNQVLEIDPVMTLMTDVEYELGLDGQSKDGCPLPSTTRSFTVLDGIVLLSTNLERAPTHFDQFPIDSVIRLNFDMVPVIDPLYGWITLTDVTDSITPMTYPVAFDSTVNGNSIVITPSDSLERSHKYELCYKIHSNIEGDYVNGCIDFFTEVNTTPPPQVTGFAVDVGLMQLVDSTSWPIDWNDTLIGFRWNTVQQADSFKIYAKDNKANSDFIQIEVVPCSEHLQYQFDTLYLPSQFDLYPNDGIQTPFSDGTEVTFAIRAWNNAGLGPFSTSITLADVVAPVFNVVQVSGSADNTTGGSDVTDTISLDRSLEYVQATNNPVFSFVEDGGDEAYALSSTDVTWTWNNSYREDTSAYITVPAGMCGAGDSLKVTIYDNSGNSSSYTWKLRPYITITNPVATTTDFEAPSHTVAWTIAQATGATQINWIDYMVTFDNGTTFIDSVGNFGNGTGGGSNTATLDDTLYSTTARVGIMNHSGGNIWYSETFTYNGILLTSPDSATYADSTPIYDALGTDSTLIPLAWNSAGVDTVVIWYNADACGWTAFDTVANTGTYSFWPPDRGGDYACQVRVSDYDANFHPWDYTTWDFDVTHDYLTITFPAASDDIEGGADTTVGWTKVGEETQNVIVQYSRNLGATWVDIANPTPNLDTVTWSVGANVPAHPDSGMLRIRDSHGLNTLDSVGPFSISGLTITAPDGSEEWLVGDGKTITWDTFNTAGVGNVAIYYSTTDWADSILIVASTANDGSYLWTVDPTTSTNAQVGVYGSNHSVGDHSSTFTIAGVTVTYPNGAENLAVGSSANITWTTIGTIANVDIQYSVDGGLWTNITTDLANAGTYTWPSIPNNPSSNVKVRVKKAGVDLGSDASNNPFTISGIIIAQPAAGVTWNIGTAYNITWTKIGLIGNVIIEYSKDGGTVWITVPGASTVNPDLGTFNWNLIAGDFPSPPYPNCRVRITEISVPTVHYLNGGNFTIQ